MTTLHATPSSKSVWESQAGTKKLAPQLKEGLTVDVVVIGAGITGLTTALFLQKAGKTVAIIEASEVGAGTSGFNSGHLTSMLLDMRYSTILKNFGKDKARLAAHSQEAAIQIISKIVQENNIDCGFKEVPGYLYAETEKDNKALTKEYEALQEVGISCDLVSQTPLPFPVFKAIRFPKQAKIDPLKYIQVLKQVVVSGGSYIYENSPVLEVKNGDPCTVKTKDGTITAHDVVMATHTPIGFRPAFQAKIEPIQSYIIGVRIKDTIEDGLYWDMEENYHYFRVVEDFEGQPLAIIGGEDHKTGEEPDTNRCFERLEEYARQHYQVISVDYKWSAQLYDPADGLPYIGASSQEPHVYVATGFSGEGLTGGTYAAKIIADNILGIQNEWAELYNPNRIKPIAAFSGLVSENVGTAAHFVGDRLKTADTTPAYDLAFGEGRLIEYNNKKVAAYRDEEGKLYLLSPVCTHAKCIVGWNSAEKSWDCPCHGGRYSATGQVLSGPPIHSLEQIDA